MLPMARTTTGSLAGIAALALLQWCLPPGSSQQPDVDPEVPERKFVIFAATGTDTHAKAITSGRNKLTHICLGYGCQRITDEVAEAIASLPHLRVLSILDCQLTQRQIELLSQSQNIQALFLRGTRMPPNAFCLFARLKKLHTLHIDRVQITDSEILPFQHHRTITRLELNKTKVTDVGVAAFASCPLEWMSLRFGKVNGQFLSTPSVWRLSYLDLSESRYADSMAPCFGRHKSLEVLLLTHTQAADGTCAALASLPRLNYLNCWATGVTSGGVKWLRRHPSLSTLILSSTKIGDAALLDLATLPRLNDLDIRQTPITDTGVKHLLGAQSLTMLYLNKKQVADLTFKRLKMQLPKLETNLDEGSLVGDD